ncbi:hypothetical protein EYB26_001432 [Talaromyces marneffei]|nr:uncharacterized protein EYB26_001432 [Talaromyces marneffei]QGA13781.1 hypothetical protein EYB26_001432 [Talaromyces marneffei]
MTPDDSSNDCDTQSLTESVTAFPFENGRRYHKYHEGLYPFPNDEQELDRLDMQHHIWKQINDNKLHFAPLRDPKRILDIGTGSGIWPIEMASHFPEASIIGTDLSPVQPTEVPPNVHFLVEDATEEWLWEPNHFDYIRIGNMTGCLPSTKDVLKKAMRVLKPGGWFEWHDIDPIPRCDDNTIPPPNTEGGFSEYALHDWIELEVKASEEYEPYRQFLIAHKLAAEMRQEGYLDVNDQITKVPLNPWPKDPKLKTLGAWYQENWMTGLSAYTYKPFLALGWTKPEIEVFLVSVRKCITNRHFHAYHNFHVVTGRKPFAGEKSPK